MRSKYWSFLFAAFVAAGLAFAAKAATRTWTGGGDGTSWSDAANWGGTAPTGSDVTTFPADKGCTITLPSGDLSGSGAFTVSGDYVFQAPANQEPRSSTWTIGGKITLNASSSLTFKNLKVNNTTGTSWALAGDLSLENTELSISSSSTIDGVAVSLKDSTFTVGSSKNLTFKESSSTKPTLLVIDNSTVRVGGGFPGTSSSGGMVVFQGKAPRLLVKGVVQFSQGKYLTAKFNIPDGGYNYIPVTVRGGNAVPVNGLLRMTVDSDSKVFNSTFDGIIPLVACREDSGSSYRGIRIPDSNNAVVCEDIDAQFLNDLCARGGDFGYRVSKELKVASDDPVLVDGVLPTLLEGPWTVTRTANKDRILGVYIKGVPTDPIPPALDGAIATEAGADGKSFSATVAVTDLGKNFDSTEVTPQVVLRYRAAGATDWIDAGAANVTATGGIRFDVTLPTAVDVATEFDVQAISHVTVENEDFDSAPIAGSVTLEPAATDAPAFAEDDALIVKAVTRDSLTMTAILSGFGNGAASCALGLMIRESGESGDGAEAATANLTAAGAVDLAVANLAPGTPYEVRVVATNDKAKTVATAWTAVSTLAVAPTLAATSVTDVGYETITVVSGLDALGAKGVTVTLNLYLREGTSGNGAVVATSNVTAVGAVELTAGDLMPETAYQAKVVASYALDEEVYSSESAWLGLTTTAVPPQFATFAADGAAGDAIHVSGALEDVAGAVRVEISKTEDFASVYDSFDAGQVAAEGSFAHTFQTADTTAANYIAPGETYYVRAVATKGGLTTVSDVIAVTTAAGSTAVVTTFTHSSSNITIVGTLDPKGAGTTEVHVLWCEDGVAYDNDVTVATIGPDDDPDWEWSTTLDDEDVLFCYMIYTKNACATAHWQTEPVTGKDTDRAEDTSAKYKWTADADGCFDGDWTDRAHWRPVKADGSDYHGYRSDYPDQDPKNVKPFDFSAIEGTNAVIALPATTVNWGTTDDVGAKNASVTFKGTPGQTVVTFSNTSERHMELAGEKVVLDGLSITFPSDLRMRNVNQTLVFKDGAVVTFAANNQSLHVQNITSAGLGSTLIVDNATLDMPPGGSTRVLWLGEGSKETTPVKLIVRGKHPLLKLTGLHTSTSSSLRPQIVFEIPEGGYAETPIVGYDKQKFAGRSGGASGKAIDLVVDRASPLMTKMTGRKRTYTLIDWAKGFNSGVVGLDHGEDLPKTRALDMYYDPIEDQESEIVSQKVKVFVKGPDGLVLTIFGTRN